MKGSTLIKRSLALVLTVVMLVSCWVFSAPTATQSAAANAGKYTVKIKFNVTDATDYGHIESDSKWTITYKKNNGRGDVGTFANRTDQSPIMAKLESTGTGKEVEFEIEGFPTKFHFKQNNQSDWGYDEVAYDITNIYVNGTEIWNGQAHLDSKVYTYWCSVDINGNKDGNDSSDGVVKSSSGAWSSKLPAPQFNAPTYTERGYTAPTEGTITTAGSYKGTDQYGVTMAGTIAVTGYTITRHQYYISGWVDQTLPNNSVSITAASGKITPNKANGYGTHDSYVCTQGTWSLNSGTTYTGPSGTWVETFFPSCSVNYNYSYNTDPTTWEVNTSNKTTEYIPFKVESATVATHSAFWGDTLSNAAPTASASQNHYYNANVHYKNNTFSKYTDAVKSTPINQPINTGTSTGHSWSGYAQFTGKQNGVFTPADYHRATCSVNSETHYKYQLHQWGTPTFTFESDGKSCTVQRQCGTSGCSLVQTQTITLEGGGITSSVKTAATCTTVGTTTYTATSPWGDGTTKTKDVNDISVLGHSWKATTFSFASDGKTATANRVCNRNASHTESQAAVVKSVEKTPATCTTDGVTTYTATSPFAGDSASASVDKTDIPALGHNTTGQAWQTSATQHWKNCNNGCGVKQDLDDHDWNDWVDKGNGKHSHTCKVCGYESDPTAHTYENVETPATCTADGFITHSCTATGCGYVYIEYPYTEATREDYLDYKALGHDLEGVALVANDAEGHYKVCKRCHENIKSDNTIGKDAHTPADAVTENSVAATCTADGSYDSVVYCSNPNCHYEISRTANVREALGHNFVSTSVRNETTLKQAPTCTTNGWYYKTCDRAGCGAVGRDPEAPNDPERSQFYEVTTEGETGYQLGHNWGTEPIPADVADGAQGYIYYECQNGCGKFCAAKLVENEETHVFEYEADEDHIDTAPNSVAGESVKVPCPVFNSGQNEAKFYGGLDYSERKSSFKYEQLTVNGITTQTMRFAGSVKVPKTTDGSVTIGLTNTAGINNVIDFGFVYTQERYIMVERPLINPDTSEPYTDGEGNPITYKEPDPTRLVIGGERIETMSVAANNSGTDITQWTNGVTPQEGSETGDMYLTFNLVIPIKKSNWGRNYVARPYITYNYNGQVITLYDEGYSAEEGAETFFNRSVAGLAETIMGVQVVGQNSLLSSYTEKRVAYNTYLSALASYNRDKAYVLNNIILPFESYCYNYPKTGRSHFIGYWASPEGHFDAEENWIPDIEESPSLTELVTANSPTGTAEQKAAFHADLLKYFGWQSQEYIDSVLPTITESYYRSLMPS